MTEYVSPEKIDADAVAIVGAFKAGLTPDPVVLVSEWADEHRYLPSETTREYGRWNTDRTPYLREPMNMMSLMSPASFVAIMKATQLGATEAGANCLGSRIASAPDGIMIVLPSIADADKYSKERLQPLIDSTPDIASKIDSKTETLRFKKFPGGRIIVASASRAQDLSMSPCALVIGEEIDRWPLDVEGQGPPLKLATERQVTFGYRRKLYLNCTPTSQANSVIYPSYINGDQRHYEMPCPHCEKPTVFHRQYFKWAKRHPETAHFVCRHCNGKIVENLHKTQMLAAGVWRPTNPSAPRGHVSYYIPGSLSPLGWKSWKYIAEAEEEAEKDFSKRKALLNLQWGLPYKEETDVPDVESLIARARRELTKQREIPEWVLVITAGIDVGIDHIEIGIWGWGENGRRHHIEQIRIRAKTNRSEAWERLESALKRRYLHPCGAILQIDRAVIDRGWMTDVVDAWTAKQDKDFIVAGKGHPGLDGMEKPAKKWARDANGKAVVGVVASVFLLLGTDWLKAELYNRLNLPEPEALGSFPEGWISFSSDTAKEWFHQLTAEELVTTTSKRGKVSRHYQKKEVMQRNEALDCACYARVAARVEGIDAYIEDDWKRKRAGLERKAKERALALEKEVRRRRDAGDSEPVTERWGVSNLVLSGDVVQSQGVTVIEDYDEMDESENAPAPVAEKDSTPASNDLAAPVEKPVTPPAEKPFFEGMKSRWGNAITKDDRPDEAGVVKKGNQKIDWKVPSSRSFLDD